MCVCVWQREREEEEGGGMMWQATDSPFGPLYSENGVVDGGNGGWGEVALVVEEAAEEMK